MLLDELPRIEYAEVARFPGYRVGTDGSVWSKLKNTRSAPQSGEWHQIHGKIDKDGYRHVILCSSGRRRYVRVATLVLEAFVGKAPPGMTAAHNNGVRLDNSVGNLRWDTHKNNISDKRKHGTHQSGEKHPQAILTDSIVLEMRAMRRSGRKLKEIADIFRVKLVTAHAAICGRTWRHLNQGVS